MARTDAVHKLRAERQRACCSATVRQKRAAQLGVPVELWQRAFAVIGGCGGSHGLGSVGAPDPARERAGRCCRCQVAVSCGRSQVSLRHLSGSVIGGCQSSNLTVNNAGLARLQSNGTAIRSRQTQVSRRQALTLVPDGWDRLSVRQGFRSFARKAWPLARTHVCHVFSLTGCSARDPRGLLMA